MAVPKRVVAIDDDQNVRTLISGVLCAPDFDTHVFASATEALELCRKAPPDLILSDYLMPGMGGGAFLEIVKSFPQLREVPFLFLTAVSLPADVLDRLRPDAVLRKPFPVQELRRVVERVIASHGQPAAETAPGGSPAAAAAGQNGGAAAPSAGHASQRFPYGRFSSLEYDGRRIQVLTEQIDSRTFTINSVITCGGVGLRRIESSLPHPLARTDDFQTVKDQIDFQHEAVLENLGRHLVLSERATLWMQDERQLPAPLLVWVIRQVGEHLAMRIGDAETRNRLRAALTEAVAAEPSMRAFQLDDAGHVWSRADDVPRAAAAAVARFTFGLVQKGLGLPVVIAGATVLHLVRERVDDLGHAGFLTALARESDPEAASELEGVRIDGLR